MKEFYYVIVRAYDTGCADCILSSSLQPFLPLSTCLEFEDHNLYMNWFSNREEAEAFLEILLPENELSLDTEGSSVYYEDFFPFGEED